MAIVKMNKFTLFAFESQKEALLQKLQQFEGVQFISSSFNIEEDLDFLKVDSGEKIMGTLLDKQLKVKFSLDFLNRFVEKEKGLKSKLKEKKTITYNRLKEIGNEDRWVALYEELKSLDESLNNYKNEITKLEGEINNLNPWSSFDASFDDLKALKFCSYFLGSIPKKTKETFKEELNNSIQEYYYEEISEIKDSAYILLVVYKDYDEQSLEMLKKYGFNNTPFTYDDTPQNIIKEKRDKIFELNKKEEEIIFKVKNYKDKIEELELYYEFFENEIKKGEALANFVKTDKVVALLGWVPFSMKDDFETLIEKVAGNSYYIEFQEPEEEDNVPVLLKNNKFAEPYEIVTSMYSLPIYKEVDPTPIMAPFFFVFFGMMLSDAGYGLTMFLGSLLALKLLPLEENAKKFMRLFLSISISTMAWGVIYGSYFGDMPKFFTPNGIKPLWVDPSLSPMSVLAVAAVMGIIHIYTGLGIKAYELIKDGKPLDAFFDVGFWYFTLTGALLLLGKSLVGVEVLGVIGKYMAIAGAVGLVATQGRENKSIIGKFFGGLFGLYNITGYLGDLLSYSRLLALGLATGLIGSSFNLMVKLLGKGVFAIVFGLIIFLFGHVFNIAINVLGAYVHACRLQYLEFFGKFYNGGGKAFTPFKLKNKILNVKHEED